MQKGHAQCACISKVHTGTFTCTYLIFRGTFLSQLQRKSVKKETLGLFCQENSPLRY